MFGAAVFGPNESFFTLKGVLEQLFGVMGVENIRFERGGGEYLHPGQKALILADGERIGEIGCVHPQVKKNFDLGTAPFIAELDFNKLLAHVKAERKFKPLSKFPIVPRDIAIVVDADTDAQTVIDVIAAVKTKAMIENITCFDVFYPKLPGEKGIPEGKKSMAFRFELRCEDHTLNDEEIGLSVKAILKALKFRLDADLRS